MIIKTHGLTKIYKVPIKGEGLKNSFKDFVKRKYEVKIAVDGLDLEIQKSEIVGLLGENGAGKTTAMKMLSGILYPTSGTVQIAGFKPTDREKEYLMKMAYITGSRNEVNWDLPIVDSLRYQQVLYKIPEKTYLRNKKMLIEMLDIGELMKIQLRRLSLGERMKMELLYNFIYSPSIVLMDEPTIGLDLKSQTSIRAFLREYRDEIGCTILMTSHYMDDIEETCDRVVILSKGKKSFDGTINELKSLYCNGKTLRLKFTKEYEFGMLKKYGEMKTISKEEVVLNLKDFNSNKVVEEIVSTGFIVSEFSISETPFRDIVINAMNEKKVIK